MKIRGCFKFMFVPPMPYLSCARRMWCGLGPKLLRGSVRYLGLHVPLATHPWVPDEAVYQFASIFTYISIHDTHYVASICHFGARMSVEPSKISKPQAIVAAHCLQGLATEGEMILEVPRW